MKYLISCVGDTDPIRNYHDGAILHIARVERPEVIVLIHSQRTLPKHEQIAKAINAIDESYRPQIKQEEEIIEKVAYFDEVFSQISGIVRKYLVEDLQEEYEYIFNLSSGTPQMKSAFFAINQIESYNIRSIQVLSPQHDSNAGVYHEASEDIDVLIERNEDNKAKFKDRCHEDKAANFSQTLVKQSMKNLINKYDYFAALELLKDQKGFPNKGKLRKELETIVDNIKTQGLPEKIEKLKYPESLKKALHAYLLIDIKMKSGELAEVLIRVKSLAEFITESYLRNKYPGIFKQLPNDTRIYLNEGKYPEVEAFMIKQLTEEGKTYHASYLNLLSYIDILQCLEPESSMIPNLFKVKQINGMRNMVAHNLGKINHWKDKEISNAVKSTKGLLMQTFKFDHRYFEFYNQINQELFELLR